MARSRIVILALLPGIFLGLAALWIFMTRPEIISNTASTVFTTINSTQETSPVTAVLFKESGIVLIKPLGETVFTPLTEDRIAISTGTEVKTEIGLAHVLLPDNSMISIAEQTQLVVAFAPKQTSIKQVLGNTYHRVEKVLDGHAYEVETPSTLATVRGTEFGVSVVSNELSRVFVIESVVDVAKIEKSAVGGWQVVESKEVNAGNEITIDKLQKQETAVVAMSQARKSDPWIVKNENISASIRQQETNETQNKNEADKEDDKKKNTRMNILEEYLETTKSDTSKDIPDEKKQVPVRGESKTAPVTTTEVTPSKTINSDKVDTKEAAPALKTSPQVSPQDKVEPSSDVNLQVKGVFEDVKSVKIQNPTTAPTPRDQPRFSR